MADYDKDLGAIGAPALPGISQLAEDQDYQHYPAIVAPDLPAIAAALGIYTPDDDPSAVFLHDIDVGYTDITAEATDDTADDCPLIPNPHADGDALYIGSSGTFGAAKFMVTTAGVGTYDIDSIQYWDGDSWEELTRVGESELNDYKSADTVFIAFLEPDDWAQVDVNGSTLYWIRFLVNGGTQTTQPLARRIYIYREPAAWTKTLTDTMYFFDGIAKDITFGTSKLTDTLNISDVLQSGLGLNRSYSDVLAITDSPGGLSSLVFDFSKIFSDALNISDAIAKFFGFNTGLQDTLTISDLFYLSGRLNLSDTLNITDSIAKLLNLNTGFQETFPISDILSIGGRLYLSDSMSISDTLVKLFGKNLGEVVTISDDVVFTIGKNLSDTVAIADSISYGAGISLQDAMAITDALQRAMFWGESETLPDLVGVLGNPTAESMPWMVYIAIGDDNTRTNEFAETHLVSEIHRKKGDVKVRANTYFVRAIFGQDEPTGDDIEIKEIGIFDSEEGGTMGARWILEGDGIIDKDNIDEIVIECEVTILHGDFLEYANDLSDSVGISDSLTMELNP